MSDDRQLPDQQQRAQQESGRPEYTPSASDTTVFSSIDSTELEIVAPAGLSGDARAAVHALPPTSALLVMQRGPSVGARFLLDAERTVAGRSPNADIFLDDVTVSRKHAEFVREGDDFVVRDIGSLNGTYVNRNRIDATVLRPGDEVQIGKYRMTFHPSPARASGGEPAVNPL